MANDPKASSAYARYWRDLVLGALGIAFGASSLTYPFGHDQGLYAYVAREWMQRGAIPYRDVFDHKTPGIYVVHAIVYCLFGDTMWGIRVAELVAMVLLGLVIARISTLKGMPVPAGLQGLSILLTSVLYYGFFDYWNTAQSEIWYSLLGLASVCAIVRGERESRAQILSGIFGGLTMIMKPPGIWLVLVAAGVLVSRATQASSTKVKSSVVGLARFGAGFFAPVAIVFAYFGLHHALGAMADIVIGANGYYIKHEPGVRTLGEAWVRVEDFLTFCAPLVPTILFMGFLQGLRLALAQESPRARRYLIGGACVVAAFAGVAMQGKFFWLHWAVMVGPLALVGTMLAADLLEIFDVHQRVTEGLAALTFGIALLYSITFTLKVKPTWYQGEKLAYAKVTHQIDRETWDDNFTVKEMYYYYRDIDDVGLWIRDHSTPEDTIAVRGFNPEIYIIAHRHYDGRFFWTNFLVEPKRAYRRDAYYAEEVAAFERSKPRYVVSLTLAHDDLNSSEWHQARGYKIKQVFRNLTVLERAETAQPDK